MSRYLIALLLAFALSLAAVAQETESAETASAASAEDDESEEADDADLDEQTYEENEDDFVPTEEIPADEPIPFPTNI